jgi:hypothetical protein
MKAERGIREDGYGERDILLFYLAEGRRILWLLLLLGSAGRDTLTEKKIRRTDGVIGIKKKPDAAEKHFLILNDGRKLGRIPGQDRIFSHLCFVLFLFSLADFYFVL